MSLNSPAARSDEVSTPLTRTQLYTVFFGLSLALFLSFVDATSITTILPVVGTDLNASASITWAGTAFLIANTSFQIITSRLSDLFGRKIVLVVSIGVFALGDLLSGFAKSAIWLYCARGIAGIGSGGINSLSMIIMSDIVTLRQRGKYQAFLGISIAAGSAAGPFLGAILTQEASWSWVFWLVAICSAATLLLMQFMLPLNRPVKGQTWSQVKKMDWAGSVLSLAMTLCLLIPISGGGTTFAWTSPTCISLLVVGVFCLALFLWIEMRVAQLPLLPPRLFTNRNVALLLAQTWLVGMVFYGNVFFAPIYFQALRGKTILESALLLLPLVLVQVVSTTVAGYWVKYTGSCWQAFTAGFLVWTAGQAAQISFNTTTSLATIAGVLTLQGIGLGATLQSTLVHAQASGLSEDRAVITGARNFARTSGGAIGLAIGNSLLNNILLGALPEEATPELREALKTSTDVIRKLPPAQRNQIETAYMRGLHAVFIYFVPVLCVCLAMCFLIKDIRLKGDTKSKESASVEDGGSAASNESGETEKVL